MNFKLVSYAVDFVSFYMQESKYMEYIRNIILFGSVSRGDESEDSDIDIFIDVVDKGKQVEKEVTIISKKFFDSTKFKNYWKLLDVERDIKIMVGDINKWKKLQPSILSNGITLYGKFKMDLRDGGHKTMFFFENIKPNTKRVLFNKNLYGYTHSGEFYRGLLQKYNGKKLSKGCITVPLESYHNFVELFRRFKIDYKIKKVIEY